MTFAEMWTKFKTVWHSQPVSVLLPLVAFGTYFWGHGHDFHSFKSFPTLGELAAGMALWTSRFTGFVSLIPGFKSETPADPEKK